jgi:hypothetical protein
MQWLWRELKRQTVSFRDIDAAFTATSDPLAFANVEMLTRVKLASLLAFVGWYVERRVCIPANAVGSFPSRPLLRQLP